MKKLTLILSISLLSAMAFAQDIVVSFTGVNANGGYQRLDSVAFTTIRRAGTGRPFIPIR